MSVQSEMTAVKDAGERLNEELASLTPEQWDLPNACGVWSVGEVVAHLAQWANAYAGLIQQSLAGEVGPPTTAPPVLPYAVRAARYAEEAKALRRALGDGLLSEYARSQRGLLAQFERVPPGEWDRPTLHPSGVRSIRALLSLRVVELSIHGWEALHRAGRQTALPDDSHEALVASLPIRLRGSFARRDPLPDPLRYLFVLTPPLLRTFKLHIHGDRFEIDPKWDESGSDTVLTLHPQTFILAFMGRITWRAALDADAIGVTGRRDLVADLAGWFPPG